MLEKIWSVLLYKSVLFISSVVLVTTSLFFCGGGDSIDSIDSGGSLDELTPLKKEENLKKVGVSNTSFEKKIKPNLNPIPTVIVKKTDEVLECIENNTDFEAFQQIGSESDNSIVKSFDPVPYCEDKVLFKDMSDFLNAINNFEDGLFKVLPSEKEVGRNESCLERFNNKVLSNTALFVDAGEDAESVQRIALKKFDQALLSFFYKNDLDWKACLFIKKGEGVDINNRYLPYFSTKDYTSLKFFNNSFHETLYLERLRACVRGYAIPFRECLLTRSSFDEQSVIFRNNFLKALSRIYDAEYRIMEKTNDKRWNFPEDLMVRDLNTCIKNGFGNIDFIGSKAPDINKAAVLMDVMSPFFTRGGYIKDKYIL